MPGVTGMALEPATAARHDRTTDGFVGSFDSSALGSGSDFGFLRFFGFFAR